jgi:hypothetical protein
VGLVEGHAARKRTFVFKSVTAKHTAVFALLPPGYEPEREPEHHIPGHDRLSILSGLDASPPIGDVIKP